PDVPRHLGGNVGVASVEIEAVHADAAGFVIADQLRLRGIGDVVNLKSAVVIAALLESFQGAQILLAHAHFGGDLFARRLALERFRERFTDCRQLLRAPPDPAHVALVIDHHKIIADAYLVAVRLRIVQCDGGYHARMARIGYVDDRRAKLP